MSIATDEAVQKYPAPTDDDDPMCKYVESVEEYDDATSEDLAGVLVGRRIVNVDSDSGMVVLDDGTELEFEDTAECCAWYSVTVEPHMDYSDNVITRVVVLDAPAFKPLLADPEYEDVYTIRVLGRDKAILDVNVEGDPTSGYYCTSFDLNVRRMPQTVKEMGVMNRVLPEPETDEMVALWARAHMNEFLPDEWQRKSAVPVRIFNMARAEALDKARQSLSAHDAQIRADAWDDGFTEGRDLAVSGQPMTRNNPYREQKQ